VPNAAIRVSVGPRRFLEEIGERIATEDPRIEVVDSLEFRDTAFPDGGWYLEDLLGPGAPRLDAGTDGVRYLAVIRDFGTTWSEDNDHITSTLPLLPAALGVATYADRMELAAVVVDLRTATPAAFVRVDAEGRGGMAILFWFGVVTLPQTKHGARTGIADAIANVVTRDAAGGSIRIAILAAESGPGHFCLLQTEWCDP